MTLVTLSLTPREEGEEGGKLLRFLFQNNPVLTARLQRFLLLERSHHLVVQNLQLRAGPFLRLQSKKDKKGIKTPRRSILDVTDEIEAYDYGNTKPTVSKARSLKAPEIETFIEEQVDTIRKMDKKACLSILTT